jgi:membrane associated rhomboid family serine protease
MTHPGRDSNDYCYRHPDRQSYILCQRCGRTICPECQTPAPVGFQCPECMRESRQSAPRTKPAIVTNLRPGRLARTDAPIVTYSIIAICVVVFLVDSFLPISLRLLPGAYGWLFAPWGIATAMFMHGGFLHLLTNMLSLWIFGRLLEPALGRGKFLVLYLLAGLGGSVAYILFATTLTGAVGASGAIFGLFAAYFVVARSTGADARPILILLGVNVLIGFLVPGIAWQAHIGGALVGALVALIIGRARRRDQSRNLQLMLGALAGGLILLALVPLAAPMLFPLPVALLGA